MPLHGLWRLGFQCKTRVQVTRVHGPVLPGRCAGTSGQQRRTARAWAEMPDSAMLCGPPVCLSLLSALEPRMTLAGLEPAIFGSEDQRLIH